MCKSLSGGETVLELVVGMIVRKPPSLIQSRILLYLDLRRIEERQRYVRVLGRRFSVMSADNPSVSNGSRDTGCSINIGVVVSVNLVRRWEESV